MSKIVERTLDFLELFAEQKRPLSLSEISRLLDIPASSCHDVLRALVDRGYLYELAPRAGYYPTLRLRDIGATIAENDPVTLRAEIILRELRDTVDESVLLSKVTGLSAAYLLAFEPTHNLRFLAAVGSQIKSLYATSAGKALLASLESHELESWFANAKLVPLTRRTVTRKTVLRAQIKAGRESGWFLNDGESIEGVTTLSGSFGWNGSIFIVTIAGPAGRVTPNLERAAQALTQACAALEMRR